MFDRNRITIGDAPWARCPTTRYRGPLGSPTGDFVDPATGESKCFPLDEGGVTLNTIGTGFVFIDNADLPGALAPGFDPVPAGGNVYCYRFRPNPAATTPGLPGFECVVRYHLSPIDLQQPRVRVRPSARPCFSRTSFRRRVTTPAILSGTYDTDFFGDGQLYADVLVTRRKSQQNGQLQLTLDYPILATDETGAPIANPLIPVDLQAFPLSGVTGVRAFADYGIYDSRQTSDFVKDSGGFRGDLPFLPSWRYDFYRRARAGRTASTASSRS